MKTIQKYRIRINQFLNLSVSCILIVFTGIPIANAQSLNSHQLSAEDSITDYSFLVSGHFHGSSNNNSGKPAQTVLENLDRVNRIDVKFLVCLGDLFKDVKNDIPAYRRLLIDKLKIPLFNAPGNHDLSGSVYEDNFGDTYYYFVHHSELFIVLNTELKDGSILGEQLELLKKALENSKSIKNIFIFTHRLIWAEDHPKMKQLFTDNTRSSSGNNFRDEILPILNAYKDKNIFLMGGSLGNAPSPFFYHKEKNITYMATAIRDTPKDAFLYVDINNGKVTFSSFPLVMPIEHYNLDYYNNLQPKAPGFSWRLIPLYIKTMLTHRFFWYGTLLTCFSILFFILIRKIRKGKRTKK